MYLFFLLHPCAELARLMLRQIRDETQRCCGRAAGCQKVESRVMMHRPSLLFHRSFSQSKNEEQETMFVCVEEMYCFCEEAAGYVTPTRQAASSTFQFSLAYSQKRVSMIPPSDSR